MSLRDLVDRKSEIRGPGDVTFSVRGLSLEDVVLLMENHTDALQHIFSQPSGADYAELVKRFPGFVTSAIAYAADEHELEDQVAKLPIGVQLRAIQEVWELSSLDVETVGNLATAILQGVTRLNDGSLLNMATQLKSGSPDLPLEQNS